MSRKSRSTGRSSHVGRVISTNASDLSLPRLPSPPRSIFQRLPGQLELFPLSEVDDRRTYHPSRHRPAPSFSRPRHRLKVPSLLQNPLAGTKALVTFSAPQNVLICVRRKIRKEVMHAFKKAGKTGQRRPRRNAYSSISCRR